MTSTPNSSTPNSSTPNSSTTTNSTPHIDKTWRDAFVIEQRLADRSGAEIGDALATVDAHCAESGESAREAFGDPTAYARSLGEGRPARRYTLRPAFVIGLALGLVGLVSVSRAFDAWAEATKVQVSAGDLVALGLAVLLTVAIALRPRPALAWIVGHPTRTFVLPFAVLIALIVPQALWRDTVAEASWPIVLGAGIIALALQVVLTWRDLTEPDPVIDPRQPAAGRTAVEWLTVFIFPFLTLIVLGMDAIFRSLT